MTVEDILTKTGEEGNFPLLDEIELGTVSSKGWKKMQSKDFRKRVLKMFGRPKNDNVMFVNFILTKQHAVILIGAIKSLKAKGYNDILEQYPLGSWNFVGNRAEKRVYKHNFMGEVEVMEQLIVVAVYKTDRDDAIAVLK